MRLDCVAPMERAFFKNINRGINKQNASENANTFYNVCVLHVYVFVFSIPGNIRPYFGQIGPYFIPYVKEM